MRFLIRFSVDEGAVGPVLAALNSHDGVVFDNLDILPLSPPRPKPESLKQFCDRKKVAGPKTSPPKAQTAREIVLDMLATDGPLHYQRIKTVLVSRGFAAGGVGSLLHNRMVKTGEIVEVSPSVWALNKPKED